MNELMQAYAYEGIKSRMQSACWLVTFFCCLWKPTDEDNISKLIYVPLGPVIPRQLMPKKFMNNFILISDSAGELKQYFLISDDSFIYTRKFKLNMQN